MLLHHSEKDILLPGAEGALHIALVEKGEVEGPCLIHHPQLDQLQPPADPGQTVRDDPLELHGRARFLRV